MKYRSSKRALALAITPETKEAVYKRDGGCLWCRFTGLYTGFPGLPEAHFIPRSHGGLGIEENILTLCRPHHDDFDRGQNREKMKKIFSEYLKSYYPEWDESKLIYRRYS